MTTVNIKLSIPSEDGPIPAAGNVEFHPTARYDAENTTVLPAPFTVQLDENGEATVELQPTDIYFAWRVREFMHGGDNYYVVVPESLTAVNLDDLERVDPETLEPIEQFAAWSDIDARVTELEEYQPPVETNFTVNGGTTGTQPTFTGAPLFTGSYVKNGPLVHFEIQVDMNNITNFGTGQYYVDLPFPAKHAYKFRAGCLHDISTGRDYETGGHVNAGALRVFLSTLDTQSGSVFDIPFTSTNPVTLSTADNFHISGTYITE
jgi:hypothetical protein